MTEDQRQVPLRPWREGEAAVLVAICDEPEVAFRTPFPSPGSPPEQVEDKGRQYILTTWELAL